MSDNEIETIVDWWITTANEDVNKCMKKLAEYGSSDLALMGSAMSRITKMGGRAGIEAAIMFYILGKVARMVGAIEQGKEPSDDTLLDLSIYSMMLRAVRAGKW